MSLTLSGKLPKGEANGLDAIVSALTDKPKGRHVVIAILDTKRLITDVESNDVVPEARIRRIEVIPEEDMEVAERVLMRAFERRTGKATLPFELEQDVKAALSGIEIDEPGTGAKSDGDDEPPREPDAQERAAGDKPGDD